MIVENLKEGFKEGNLEGRCVLLSSLFLSSSIYISGFNVLISLCSIAISAAFSKGKVLRFIFGFLPVIILLFISSLISGFNVLIAFIGILCSGALITSSKYPEIAGALIYFRFPEKFVSYVGISLALLPTVINDLENVKFLYGRSVKEYYSMLKAFVAAVIIRSLSLGETLYSKGFTEKIYYEVRKPNAIDLALLSLSSLLFLSTVLQPLLFQSI